MFFQFIRYKKTGWQLKVGRLGIRLNKQENYNQVSLDFLKPSFIKYVDADKIWPPRKKKKRFS